MDFHKYCQKFGIINKWISTDIGMGLGNRNTNISTNIARGWVTEIYGFPQILLKVG